MHKNIGAFQIDDKKLTCLLQINISTILGNSPVVYL